MEIEYGSIVSTGQCMTCYTDELTSGACLFLAVLLCQIDCKQ